MAAGEEGSGQATLLFPSDRLLLTLSGAHDARFKAVVRPVTSRADSALGWTMVGRALWVGACECPGGLFRESQGTLLSPGFPKPLCPGLNCTWTIQVPHPTFRP